MNDWQRPTHSPIPRRQAFTDALRRVDPRLAARRVLIVAVVALLSQLGWEWRSATVALGTRQTVAVLTSSLPAGMPVTHEHVEFRPWPVGLTPEGAIDALPLDAVAAVDLVAGEVLVAGRLLPSANGLGVGQRMVTIAQPLAPPPLEPGVRVELFGIMPLGDGFTTPATRLTSGTIIESSETAISIAVESSAVPALVEHAALGSIEVVILP